MAEDVAHGKTILVEALTGKLTLMHSEELKRGITIRLGYADATLYRCKNGHHFSISEKCPHCFEKGEMLRTVSFIDLPGHETLMATVLTGASLMDGAILVIAANEKCPQPQTREHLMALEAVGIKNVVVVQNKIDLVTRERALENYEEIKRFLEGTAIEDAPIIPVSAQQRINIDAVIQAVEERIPTPKRERNKNPYMLVARSFDVNRPGTRPKDLRGGVLGGALIEGKFKIDDEIEIRPGVLTNGGCEILNTKIRGLQKAGVNLKDAGPGGLVGVMTELDPSLTKSDNLVGNVVGLPGKLPEVQNEISIEFKLLERAIGTKELARVEPIGRGENLLINIGIARSLGAVKNVSKDILEIGLKIPVCARNGERVVISRQISGRWRLIGYGNLI